MKLFIAYLGITAAFACQFKGKTYKNDEEWTENESFKMKCRIEPNGSWRTEVSGCVTPDKVVVPVNDQIDIGDHTWECKLNPGGRIVFEQKMNKHAACNGHPFDSEWKEKSFQFKCGEHGVTKFVGCVTASGVLIKDGETLVQSSDRFSHRLTKSSIPVSSGMLSLLSLEASNCIGKVHDHSEWYRGLRPTSRPQFIP